MLSLDLPPLKSLPVSRLPNELLTYYAFAIVANLDEDATFKVTIFRLLNGIRIFMKWVGLIMLVCCHWRDVGLSSPWLWR